eukprot:303226-Chlamydomonas_euryale.AAC.2
MKPAACCMGAPWGARPVSITHASQTGGGGGSAGPACVRANKPVHVARRCHCPPAHALPHMAVPQRGYLSLRALGSE